MSSQTQEKHSDVIDEREGVSRRSVVTSLRAVEHAGADREVDILDEAMWVSCMNWWVSCMTKWVSYVTKWVSCMTRWVS